MAGCLGEGEARMWRCLTTGAWSLADKSHDGWEVHNCKLQLGGQQSFVFAEGDPPPFYKLDAPKLDRVVKKNRKRKKATVLVDVVEEGYVGKAKGMQQVLWERGLWVRGMVQRINVDKDKKCRGLDMSMSHVLSMCTDFVEEWSAFKKLVHDRGHVLLTSPKGHPELAGVGIEYGWGGSKLVFRRTNDCVAKNLHSNIVRSFGVLTKARTRKYARRARAYRTAYKSIASTCTSTEARVGSFELVEKMVQVCKIHRCILNQETKYLKDSISSLEEETYLLADVDVDVVY